MEDVLGTRTFGKLAALLSIVSVYLRLDFFLYTTSPKAVYRKKGYASVYFSKHTVLPLYGLLLFIQFCGSGFVKKERRSSNKGFLKIFFFS